MLRLLFVSTVASFIRAFLLPYSAYFRARGWRVDAMASGITGCVDCATAFNRTWDVHWSRNPLDISHLGSTPSAIRRIVTSQRYDIVHVHTPVAGMICRFALRHGPPPVRIYTAHGFHFHDNGRRLTNRMFSSLERIAGRWTDQLVVINRQDADAAARLGILPSTRLVYMPGIGLDTANRYNPRHVSDEAVGACRQALGIGARQPVLLMIAEFQPNKRHRDALVSFAKLRMPDAHLLLAGDGPLVPQTRCLATELGVAGRVHFLGVRQDIPVLIRSSNATLLCSDREGLPRSVMESLSLETPVIGSDVRGTRDLIRDGAGCLYPPRDTGSLCQAMAWLLEHPHEASEMGRKGRRSVADYDIARLLSLHEDMYLSALADRPTTREMTFASCTTNAPLNH